MKFRAQECYFHLSMEVFTYDSSCLHIIRIILTILVGECTWQSCKHPVQLAVKALERLQDTRTLSTMGCGLQTKQKQINNCNKEQEVERGFLIISSELPEPGGRGNILTKEGFRTTVCSAQGVTESALFRVPKHHFPKASSLDHRSYEC